MKVLNLRKNKPKDVYIEDLSGHQEQSIDTWWMVKLESSKLVNTCAASRKHNWRVSREVFSRKSGIFKKDSEINNLIFGTVFVTLTVPSLQNRNSTHLTTSNWLFISVYLMNFSSIIVCLYLFNFAEQTGLLDSLCTCDIFIFHSIQSSSVFSNFAIQFPSQHCSSSLFENYIHKWCSFFNFIPNNPAESFILFAPKICPILPKCIYFMFSQ